MTNLSKFFLALAFLGISAGAAWSQPICGIGPRANTADDPSNGIYVSTTGNDATATGAIDKPYKSITAALAAAGANKTIILRGGTYTQPVGTAIRIQNPNVTIKSAKGEWAHINLPYPTPITSTSDQNSTIRFDVNSSGSKLQSIEVSGGFYAVCFETKWDWGQPDRTGASNIIIEDCILHDSRYEVVKVKPLCNNITIRYCEIYNPAIAEVGTPKWNSGEAHGEAVDNVNAHNMKIQNCYMHDLLIGLYAKGGAEDALFENNRIENCRGAGIAVAFDTSPEFFDTGANPQYYECINTIVRNNLIINTGWEGIGLYAAKNPQIYNNTIVNAGTYANYARPPIYFGTVSQDYANPTGCPGTFNPNIHHNVISQPSTYGTNNNNRMIDIRENTITLDPPYSYPMTLSGVSGMPVMDYNCYYISGKTSTFRDQRASSPLNSNFAAWKTHISNDAHSVETNPALDANYMTTNPLCAGMGITCSLVPNGTTNIAETNVASIQIYPNPVKDELRIMNYELRIMNVEIIDLAGRTVETPLAVIEQSRTAVAQMQNAQRAGASPAPTGTATINVSSLPQGIYLVKIYTDKGIVTERFIKM